MEIEVSIDKFNIDYKDVPHLAFLRVYMVGVKKYKVKMKIYSGTFSYEPPALKKLKKKVGNVFMQARKLKNNLSPKQLINKLKKT